MVIPLKKSLTDADPYVRKTAVFSVVKLYGIIPETVENAKLFDDLLQLLHDDNPMVVSNTTAAIFEINERRTTPIFTLNSDTISLLLNTVNSSSEWCQIILFDALSRYQPNTPDDASFLIDRLLPFLKHGNPAVVIGSFRCVFLFMNQNETTTGRLFPQIIPPFITLVNAAEAEIQYIVLRTLSLFVQRYPRALSKEIRSFFCKYNDPSYIKM
jgi:vesicle coat complex subunit